MSHCLIPVWDGWSDVIQLNSMFKEGEQCLDAGFGHHMLGGWGGGFVLLVLVQSSFDWVNPCFCSKDHVGPCGEHFRYSNTPVVTDEYVI